MMELIKATNLLKIYNEKHPKSKKSKRELHFNRTTALNGVDISVCAGDFISIMGKSGCGKSTLLRILGGIDEATEGEVTVDGVDLTSCSDDTLSDARQKTIGFVFQEFYLVDSLTIKENILLPLQIGKVKYDVAESMLAEKAKNFDIEGILSKYPPEVSGGERQRAAICRAIINEPKIILADEPTGNLDSMNSTIVIKHFEKLNTEENRTILMVTHDPTISGYSKTVLFMKDGRIVKRMDKEPMEDRKQFIQRIVEGMEY